MAVENKDKYAQLNLPVSNDLHLTEESPLFTKPSSSLKATEASKRRITIEPVIFFSSISCSILISGTPQYLKERLTNDRNLNSSFDDYSDNSDCSAENISAADRDILQQIQADLSLWGLVCTCLPLLAALFLAPLLGSWGNKVSRKVTLAIPIAAFVLQQIILLLVIIFELPLWVIPAGGFLGGMGGHYFFLLGTCLAYIADVTIKDKRAFRIVIVQVAFVLGLGIGQVVFGFLIEMISYAAAYIVALILMILVLLYIFVPPFLIETIEPNTTTNSNWMHLDKSVFQEVVKLFRANTDSRRIKLILMMLLSFVCEIFGTAALQVSILYGLGLPFCMSPVEVGLFSATKLISSTIGMAVGNKLLGMCFSDVWIMHIGIFFSFIFGILFALANTTQGLFLVAIVTNLKAITQPINHLMLSKLVKPEEQGVVFSVESSACTLAALVSPLIFNTIYAATVTTYSGFVFIVFGVAQIFPMGILIMFQIINRSKEHRAPHAYDAILGKTEGRTYGPKQRTMQ